MFFLKLQLHTDSHMDDFDAELRRGNIWNSYTAGEFRLTANLYAPRSSSRFRGSFCHGNGLKMSDAD